MPVTPAFFFTLHPPKAMKFTIQILGSSSALPTAKRFPSAQIVSFNDAPMLVDCGEGTQIQLRKFGISFSKIEHLYISHLHGDHYFGIFGLLNSMNMLGRKKPLHLYAPAELKKILNYIWRTTSTKLLFELKFHPLISTGYELLAETKYLEIYTFPLAHSKANWGFKFVEKPQMLRIRKEAIETYQPGIAEIHRIKQGESLLLDNGTVVPNEDLVIKPPSPRSYAYCTDTMYLESLNECIGNTNVLYHEATFSNELAELAKLTGHSTASQAATVASNLNAKALIIGHYSTRYPNVEFLKIEASQIFNPVFLAEEGTCFEIDQQTRELSMAEIK